MVFLNPCILRLQTLQSAVLSSCGCCSFEGLRPPKCCFDLFLGLLKSGKVDVHVDASFNAHLSDVTRKQYNIPDCLKLWGLRCCFQWFPGLRNSGKKLFACRCIFQSTSFGCGCDTKTVPNHGRFETLGSANNILSVCRCIFQRTSSFGCDTKTADGWKLWGLPSAALNGS